MTNEELSRFDELIEKINANKSVTAEEHQEYHRLVEQYREDAKPRRVKS